MASAKQNWTIGETVKIGFMANLTVLEKVSTPNDYRPDLYVLQSAKGVYYSFVPHNGLARCESLAEARCY